MLTAALGLAACEPAADRTAADDAAPPLASDAAPPLFSDAAPPRVSDAAPPLFSGAAPPLFSDAAPPRALLPDTATPLGYRIALDIDPDAPRFSGEVEIDIELNVAARQIWMHGRGLDMQRVTLSSADGDTTLAAGAFTQTTDDGVVLLTFDRERPAGELTLGFRYEAPFDPELLGLYRVQSHGRWYAITQFQDIGARRAFPGFDEPRFKTPFDVKVSGPASGVVIGNTPPVEELETGDRREVRFATTPPLPTYLLAFAVGPYDVETRPDIPASALRDTPVPLRGLAVAGRGSELDVALAGTPELLLEHERYFGLAYPFAKLDLAAVPDFQAGAMENVGLITFRDVLLLFGPSPTVQQRRGSTMIQSHELAHQWFGNLTTPRWWDDIWLNESFASWAGARAAHLLDPGAGYRTGELAGTLGAMDDDSFASARRLREPVRSSDDIANAFDGITYSKGSGVLRMFEAFVGAERFRDAVHQHLERFRFGTATAADFVDSLSKATGDPTIATAFRSFLDQAGVPQVDAAVSCSGSKAKLVLTTQRYLPLGSVADPVADWTVPFCVKYGTADGTRDVCTALVSGEQQLPLDECPAWVLPNRGGDGYYRWTLEPQRFADLLTAYNSLDADEQLVIADALASGFSAGRVEVPELLAALPAIADSRSPYAVRRILEPLRWLHAYAPAEARVTLEARYRQVFEPRRKALIENAPTPLDQVLRDDLTKFLAVSGGDTRLRNDLSSRAQEHLSKLSSTPDVAHWDLLETAVRVALETKRLDPRDLVRSLASTERSDVRDALLKAVGSARTQEAAATARELVVSSDIRTNERIDLLFSMFPPEGAEDAWAWLLSHPGVLSMNIPEFDMQALPALAASLCRRDRGPEVDTFFRKQLAGARGAERSLRRTLESIDICAATLTKHTPGMTALAPDAPSPAGDGGR